MHELSILMEVIKTVERQSADFEGQAVVGIVLEIGELSSVVPEYIKSYYPDAVQGTILENAELTIESIKAIAQCKACNREFEIVTNRAVCPVCDNKEIKVLNGREFLIKEIAVE